MIKQALLVSVAMVAFPAAAHGAEAEAAADAGADDQAILVIGHADGYAASESATATKTNTPLIDVPQTIRIVTRQQLDDQAQRSIADVLRYVPGTTVGQGEGNRDQITIRGQATTADFFIDGVRDDVQYYRSLYNIERVEVLKGPAALIFGRGGGGGIINRVQKAPSADRLFGGAQGSINSFGAWDLSADVNAPLSDTTALRVNGFYENLANHRDHFDGERLAVNPNVATDLGNGWKAGLSYEYVHDDRVTDRGVPSLECAQPCTPGPLPGYRSFFFGIPGINRNGVDAHIVKARLDGTLAENLTWSTTVLYGNYDKYYGNVFANGAASAQNGTVKLGAYTDATQRENVLAQTNLVWDVNLGPIGNKVLLGLEYADQISASQRRDGVLSSPTLNLANPVFPSVTFPALTRSLTSHVKVFSAYAQDQISLGRHLDLLVGLRYDRFQIRGTALVLPDPSRNFARTDERVSPRVGVIVKPRENISIYGSYSQSFLPRAGDQFLNLTPTQQSLRPEKFTNYEAGAKWDIRPDLSTTLALFQLDRSNATTPNPLNPTLTIDAGATRTRGVEFGIAGRITPQWQLSGGYTFQDGKLRDNASVRLSQVPRHQFALWNRYDFNKQVGVGIGVTHQSSAYAAIRTVNTITLLPAFTRVDAALFFNASERVQFQVNVENVLDTTYFSDAHNANNISPGAPINARLSARVRF